MHRKHGNLRLIDKDEEWPLSSEAIDESKTAPAAPNPEDLSKALEDLLSSLNAKESSNSKKSITKELSLRNFRSDKYRLTEPLSVSLEEEDGTFVATSYDTAQYGVGICPEDALEHLCAVVEDYYELLLEDRERLGRQPRAHLKYLERVLEPI